MEKLDLLDRRIMHALDLDARQSSSGLARKLRKSKETVNFRLNRLLEEGYIKGFYTITNTSLLGWFYYKIYLKLRRITPQKENELIEYAKKQKHIAYLASMEGHYDCVCLLMVQSSVDLANFLTPFMKEFGEYIEEREIVTFMTTHRLNQKVLFDDGESHDWHYPYEIGKYDADEADRKILHVISSNARMPLIEIAKTIGVDAKIVKYHLKKLERDRAILAYVTAPDFSRLGLQFVQLNISLSDPSYGKKVIAFFDGTKKCLFAIEMVGKYDLTIEVHVESNSELHGIIDNFREKFADRINGYDIATITKEHVVVWGPF